MKRLLRWVAHTPRVRMLGVFCALTIASQLMLAQYIPPYVSLIGSLTTAGGTPAANGTLTFNPSQVFFVAGTQIVVGAAQCSTDANGAIAGLPNPVSPARATAQTGVGTLPPGTYHIRFAWYDQFGGISLASPEIAVQLSATGELQILPPVGAGPANAVGMKVYIGTTPGSETLQGTTNTPTAQYTQAAALATGQPSPGITNTSICRVVANDAGWPTGTGYTVSLVDANGNTLFSYTEMWQFLGAGSTYNLSIGIPYYHGQVTYPVPILSTPYNHNPQSISGPLSLTNYNLYNVGALGVGTGLPGYGVDVEGAGNDSQINAAGGYWVNGQGGATGQTQCLASVNGGPYDTPFACISAGSLPTLFYQTIGLGGTAQTQRSMLNFGAYFTATDSSSPSETTIGLNVFGTDTKLATTSASATLNYFACGDANGGIGWSVSACTGSPTAANDFFKFSGCSINNSGNLNSCAGTVTFTSGGNTTPSFPAMADTNYRILCTVDTGTTSSASFSVQGSTNSGNTPAFTRTTSGFNYVWTEVMSNGAAGSAAPIIDCYLHHD
jgi:hypothetical protein